MMAAIVPMIAADMRHERQRFLQTVSKISPPVSLLPAHCLGLARHLFPHSAS
jgi:hypothetical protein